MRSASARSRCWPTGIKISGCTPRPSIGACGAGLAGGRWVRAFAEGVELGESPNAVREIDELASESYLRQNCSSLLSQDER